MNRVPNQHPTVEVPYRLAIVGEHPFAMDELVGRLFTGTRGNLLQTVTQQVGLMQSACLLANVCQFVPPNEELWHFKWNEDEIQDGIMKLRHDIKVFNPHCVLLLGKAPLKLAGIEFTVDEYRGSIFQCKDTSSPFYGRKCVGTYEMSDLNKQYENVPLFAFDVKRAFEESHSPEYVAPVRVCEVELTANQIIERLNEIKKTDLTSIDIEGGVTEGITCLAIATSANKAFIVNILDFTTPEKERILRALSRVLLDHRIPKVLQNSLYDNFCLSWKWKLPILNVQFDTMLAGWEMYCELPKGLATLTSLHTKEPFYKFERKVADKLTHYRYCCKDAMTTWEIAKSQMSEMSADARRHFHFNMQLLPAVMYMELRGIKYDKEKANERLRYIQNQQALIQQDINHHAGQELNVNSPKQMKSVIYDKLRYPPQYKREKGRKTTTLTTDANALLNLLKDDKNDLIMSILRWRALDGQRKQLTLDCDPDGRIRCSYNLVGTETGRMTCYESPTGSGSNLTTIMSKNKDLYVADEDYDFFQCDLSGADGWTVAAHCSRVGDDTMLKDYYAGIKPAKVIAAMYQRGKEVSKLSQSDMLDLIADMDSKKELEPWLYFVCKMIQHGSNYGMKKDTMSKNILVQSWKKLGQPIYFSPHQCERLQSYYIDGRYRGIRNWWLDTERTLRRDKALTCASGHIRHFFGREGSHQTLQQALAHEPQANTTYATNRAMYNLWHDSDNRGSNGNLIIQPLHQVHDAVDGQWPRILRDWACEKIKAAFNNELSIAGMKLVIPFEGGYGPNWKQTKTPI